MNSSIDLTQPTYGRTVITSRKILPENMDTTEELISETKSPYYNDPDIYTPKINDNKPRLLIKNCTL